MKNEVISITQDFKGEQYLLVVNETFSMLQRSALITLQLSKEINSASLLIVIIGLCYHKS
jgi:hypothetical protein